MAGHALARRPEDRYGSAAEMAAELQVAEYERAVAVPGFEEALGILEPALGGEHPQVAVTPGESGPCVRREGAHR